MELAPQQINCLLIYTLLMLRSHQLYWHVSRAHIYVMSKRVCLTFDTYKKMDNASKNSNTMTSKIWATGLWKASHQRIISGFHIFGPTNSIFLRIHSRQQQQHKQNAVNSRWNGVKLGRKVAMSECSQTNEKSDNDTSHIWISISIHSTDIFKFPFFSALLLFVRVRMWLS